MSTFMSQISNYTAKMSMPSVSVDVKAPKKEASEAVMTLKAAALQQSNEGKRFNLGYKVAGVAVDAVLRSGHGREVLAAKLAAVGVDAGEAQLMVNNMAFMNRLGYKVVVNKAEAVAAAPAVAEA